MYMYMPDIHKHVPCWCSNAYLQTLAIWLFGHFICTGSHATEYVFLDMSYSFHHLYRQQKLQFRPPIEELRAKYYRDMKKFMCIPLHFRGVGESGTPANTIFPRLIDRNASSFFTVYRKVE